MFGFEPRIINRVIDPSPELQIRIDKLELDGAKLQQTLELERTKFESVLDIERAKFEQEKELWMSKTKQEKEMFQAKLLLKQDQDVAKIRNEHAKELVTEKEVVNRELYQKLGTELSKLHTEGNQASKFMQDLALKMVDRSPQLGYTNEQTTKGK